MADVEKVGYCFHVHSGFDRIGDRLGKRDSSRATCNAAQTSFFDRFQEMMNHIIRHLFALVQSMVTGSAEVGSKPDA